MIKTIQFIQRSFFYFILRATIKILFLVQAKETEAKILE